MQRRKVLGDLELGSAGSRVRPGQALRDQLSPAPSEGVSYKEKEKAFLRYVSCFLSSSGLRRPWRADVSGLAALSLHTDWPRVRVSRALCSPALWPAGRQVLPGVSSQVSLLSLGQPVDTGHSQAPPVPQTAP